MSKKHDRQGARTPADLERKYGFDKIKRMAEEAQKSYSNLNQEQIFNKLTNNGQWEGFFYDSEGNMYINASYIKSGVFLADLIKAGVLQSVDGETFKLDLEKGIMTLKSGGNVVMNVDENGATLSGWKVNKNYLGTDTFGMNGDLAIVGTSANGGTSPIRFFAGSYSSAKKTVTVLVMPDSSGWFEAQIVLDNIVSAELAKIASMESMSGVVFTEDDLDEIVPITITNPVLNSIAIQGKFKADSGASGNRINITIEYYAQSPAFQVLEDGTLVSQYAILGGYSIADIIKRIEALEGK